MSLENEVRQRPWTTTYVAVVTTLTFLAVVAPAVSVWAFVLITAGLLALAYLLRNRSSR